jgi:anaerobic ribonucleoside-triphosphate reductase activating protein
MRYHNITKEDMLNGDGLRVVLWVSGCTHKCKGCHNPVTWNKRDGLPFNEKAKQEIFDELDKPHISGITLSGGDPLAEFNRDTIAKLVKEIKEKYPTKTIWLYTGYIWEEIYNLEAIPYLDVIVDGEFVLNKKDDKLHWKGSSNQRVIDVQATIKSKKTVIKET